MDAKNIWYLTETYIERYKNWNIHYKLPSDINNFSVLIELPVDCNDVMIH